MEADMAAAISKQGHLYLQYLGVKKAQARYLFFAIASGMLKSSLLHSKRVQSTQDQDKGVRPNTSSDRYKLQLLEQPFGDLATRRKPDPFEHLRPLFGGY